MSTLARFDPRCLRAPAALAAVVLLTLVAPGPARAAKATIVPFNLDSIPQYTPLPTTETSRGVVASFTGTGYSYSIQAADVLGFIPKKFSGHCLYPNSVYAADLMIAFSHPVNGIVFNFAPEEYATDSSATIQLTAALGATYVGTATAVAPVPGTWPTGTMKFQTTKTFDNVTVHYLKPPPTGGDWGPIFMVDNIQVRLAP